MPWDWNHWDYKQRQRLTDKLEELLEHGLFVAVHTRWPALAPVFHKVNGEWQLSRDGQHVYAGRHRFGSDLERRKREEQQLKVWRERNQPQTYKNLEPATGPGIRSPTLGPHDGAALSTPPTSTGPTTGEQAASIALDVTPVVGPLKSSGQVISGTDLVTGERVHRGMEMVGVIAGIVPGGKAALKVVSKALTTKIGRAQKQARLRELANDDKLGSADRGWIKQELNSIERGQRSSIRNPPGKDLAHERGREAAKGFDYSHSNLQDRDLHRLQHRYDNFGRANKSRPTE